MKTSADTSVRRTLVRRAVSHVRSRLRVVATLATAIFLTAMAAVAGGLPANAQVGPDDGQDVQLDEHGLPDNLPEELKTDLLAACPNPSNASDGVGAYEIIDDHLDVTGDQLRILLREGTSRWGRLHIEQAGDNHELNDFAKDQWLRAWNLGAWLEVNPDDPCFVKMSAPYTTPGGTERTMCVLFDFKEESVYGSKGVTTGYWKRGWVGTVNC